LNPREDIEIINVELALADLAQLEKKIKNLDSDVKGDKNLIPQLELSRSLKDHLSRGLPASSHPDIGSTIFQDLNKEMRFLTAKPVIYAVNVDETGLLETNPFVEEVSEIARECGSDMVVLCGKLEEEMVDMAPDEISEFLELIGAKASGLDQIVELGFKTLGLINYFTKNENEVRAWTIPQGTKAPQAAGKIHTDFEKGFIRAEVVSYDEYKKLGSDAAVKSAGMMRSEGKDYVVADGDVILFRFNV
jgi:GTP-binding protein YchF